MAAGADVFISYVFNLAAYADVFILCVFCLSAYADELGWGVFYPDSC